MTFSVGLLVSESEFPLYCKILSSWPLAESPQVILLHCTELRAAWMLHGKEMARDCFGILG